MKEKWLKFREGQYHFEAPFRLYSNLVTILKPVEEQYKDKMNQMKTERRNKTPYTKKLSTRMYLLAGVYTSPLLIEMFLIH